MPVYGIYEYNDKEHGYGFIHWLAFKVAENEEEARGKTHVDNCAYGIEKLSYEQVRKIKRTMQIKISLMRKCIMDINDINTVLE